MVLHDDERPLVIMLPQLLAPRCETLVDHLFHDASSNFHRVKLYDAQVYEIIHVSLAGSRVRVDLQARVIVADIVRLPGEAVCRILHVRTLSALSDG
jgi:hypothetical protein